ncbi:MAG: Gfo/Idh/MocA family oxidoreductase [Planctomycetota bacterium]|nr:Gfo/Idh/MocA family oxidoreductase [Planctomycetota bacterium]
MIVINCIGAGHWGPNLIKVFTTIPDVRVNLACDTSQERLDLVRQRIPGIAGFTQDANRAIEDDEADAVIIATPVHTHSDLALKALNAGKHVFVEKPLCKTSAEGQALVEAAERNARLLCVGHVFLFNNAIRGIRNLIRRGELGRILYLHATRTNLGPVRSDVNALWDLASHDLSIFNYWLQAQPLTVSAHGASLLNADIEDVVVAGFRYPDGINAYVHASWLNPRKVREIIVTSQ